ncbi:ADP-ribosylglycohydrolase family protein [Micromonospora haikouensis]|uniref:ADP-ribosylglycohydrolase family protein n=1 Tax=Micromonospora haikouensis TaxID=686309 RepID=UPI0037880DE8
MQVPISTGLGDATGHLAGTRGRAALLAAAAAEAVAARLGARTAPTSAEISTEVGAHVPSASAGPHTSSAIALARQLSRSVGTISVDKVMTGLRQTNPYPCVGVASDDSAAGGTVGPAVWIWPVGLLALPLEQVAALAGEIAVRSTTIPLSQDTAVAHAVAVAVATRSTGIEPAAFVDTVAAHAVTPPLREALRVTKMLLRARAEPAFVAAQFPTRGRSPRRCFASALTAFLLHPGDPVAAIRVSLAQAGVSEVAVMAAALAGAHTGEQALPANWRSTAARHLLTRWPAAA